MGGSEKVVILGSVKSPEFQRVSRVCQKLSASNSKVDVKIEHVAPIDYIERLNEMKQEVKDFIPSLFPGVVARVYTSGKLSVKSATSFISWAQQSFNVGDVTGQELGVSDDAVDAELENLGQTAFEAYIRGLNHTIVHMDVQVGSLMTGRLWFELYNDIVPLSTAHFVSLISGTAPNPAAGGDPVGYKNSTVNRIIKEGWFQAGEIMDMKGSVLVNDYLPDENFIIPHNHRGNLSFVNKGPHSNYSQFMVTFRPMPYFDRKFTCIGRCLDGDNVLQAIDEVKTRYEKPAMSIRINKCGVFCEGTSPPEKDLLPTFF
ncbi:cyclophilin-like domain-containing protein [Obelidium mucronatum]|nr:cyclophilin-like domain-containing protein [Obelidium mucronatum]